MFSQPFLIKIGETSANSVKNQPLFKKILEKNWEKSKFCFASYLEMLKEFLLLSQMYQVLSYQ